MAARARILLGTETEYAITAFDRAGQVLPAEATAKALFERAAARLSLPATESGVFLTNGARFYIDAGRHPEYASAECTNPWDAVRHALAGDVLMRQLAAELLETHPDVAGLVIRKGNVDDVGRSTWASHENYLHACAPAELRPGLIPHLVSRIIFTGSGGIDPFARRRARFILSPRALFVRQIIGASSPGAIALVDERSQALCAGFHRQHVVCGDANWSHLSLFLRLATTALLVALLDRGLVETGDVTLAAPLRALRTVTRDTTLRAALDLASGRRTTALRIQQHYLRQARMHQAALPEWAGAVCDIWQDTLDRLAHGPEAVADRLDWAIKRAVFRSRAARRRRAVAVGEADAALFPWKLAGRWRAESCTIDLAFGYVHPSPLFEGLDSTGLLRHRVPGVDLIEQAMAEPPAEGRARIRGDAVRRLSGDDACATCDWQGVRDLSGRRDLDLTSPFAEWELWRAFKPTDMVCAVLVTRLAAESGRPPSTAATQVIRRLSEHVCEASAAGDAHGLSPIHALQLNDCGFALRKAGRFEDTLWLMRAALGVELAVRPAGHPKLAHRRNNLATVLLILGRLDEAREELSRAWQVTARRFDLTSARILTIRWTVATLAGESAGPFLGQLKTLLAAQPLPDFADVSRYWQVTRLVEALSPRFAREDAGLLTCIGDVLNGDRAIELLDDIPAWRNASPVALELRWLPDHYGPVGP